MKVLEAKFVKQFINLCFEGYQKGWHERNGGNLSYRIKKEEVESIKENFTYQEEREIGTIIHYPIPPHLSEAYRYLNMPQGSLPITEQYAKTVLSIPLYNGMTAEEQTYVIDAINSFC